MALTEKGQVTTTHNNMRNETLVHFIPKEVLWQHLSLLLAAGCFVISICIQQMYTWTVCVCARPLLLISMAVFFDLASFQSHMCANFEEIEKDSFRARKIEDDKPILLVMRSPCC